MLSIVITINNTIIIIFELLAVLNVTYVYEQLMALEALELIDKLTFKSFETFVQIGLPSNDSR